MDNLKTMLKLLERMNNKLVSIKEHIQDLQTLIYPQAQTISDMPKGGGRSINNIEEYVEKVDYWDNERKRIQSEAAALKKKIEAELHRINATEGEKRLIYYKYDRCMAWKDTALAMGWTMGKCFSVYNKLIRKSLQKNQKTS